MRINRLIASLTAAIVTALALGQTAHAELLRPGRDFARLGPTRRASCA